MKSVKIMSIVLLIAMSSFSAITICGFINGPSIDGSVRSNVIMLFKGDSVFKMVYPTFICTTQTGISVKYGKPYSSDTNQINWPWPANLSWRGTVRPIKPGFVFTPEFCRYPDSADSAQAYNPLHIVTHTYVQNYTARDTASPIVIVYALSDIALGDLLTIKSKSLDNSRMIRKILTYFSSDSGKTFNLIDSVGISDYFSDSLRTFKYTPQKASSACQVKTIAFDAELNSGVGYSNIFVVTPQITQMIPVKAQSVIQSTQNTKIFDPLGRVVKNNNCLLIKKAVNINGQKRILKIH